ncbi:MAG: thiamine pyrophosphate-dependent enzyme [Anaerolineae bacterium]
MTLNEGETITGSEALARGALDAGVQMVTGYPGSPTTATVDALLRLAPPDVQIEWAINEKSAFDTAFGASLAGVRALLCLKSVGLNVALDSLMVSNLAPGDGGFVILAGDDPGGWGSQNEQDSRLLAASAEVPLLEPTSAAQARETMRQAFDLSEAFRLPVVVRITRALAGEAALATSGATESPTPARPAVFRRQGERLNVLPIHVVDYHRQLQERLGRVQAAFENSDLNRVEGAGRLGVLVAGQTYHKLAQTLDQILAQDGTERPAVFSLATLHPLPEERLSAWLQEREAVLVLEETAPYLEVQAQALAQRTGLALPIYGRKSSHLPGAGELFAPEISAALAALLPGRQWPAPGEAGLGEGGRPLPSRQPLCDDCPYLPALRALLATMERRGGRDQFVVTGETGCMVRAQLPPLEILDMKYGMGSSIGLATGLARAGIEQQVVALAGDSAFLHSGLGELIDADQAGANLLVVLLDNEITALSGGQPHPATGHSARGGPRRPVDLVALVRAAGVGSVRVVDPDRQDVLEAAFEKALQWQQLSVVIVRQACPRWIAPL